MTPFKPKIYPSHQSNGTLASANSVECVIRHFSWTVDKNSLTSIIKGQNVGDFIQSPVLNNAWYFLLYPYNKSKRRSQLSGLYVINAKDQDVEASVTINLGTNCIELYHYVTFEVEAIFPAFQGHGKQNWIFRSDLESICLSDEVFVISGKVLEKKMLRLEKPKLTNKVQPIQPPILKSSCEETATKENPSNTTTTLLPDLYEQLVGNNKCSDVSFMINSEELHAHRVILMTGSNVFDDMLRDAKKVDDKWIVEIENVDYGVFKELLRFIYVGRVNNFKTIAKDLLIVSHKFGLEKLKHKCEEVLCSNFSLDTVFKYLKIADFCKCEELKTQSFDFIAANIEDAINHPEFKSFNEMGLMKEIVVKMATNRKSK